LQLTRRAPQKPRPRRGGGPTPELQARLQNALIEHAQHDALREREKKVAKERDKNIERRGLPSQAMQCMEAASSWDSRTCKVVYTVPTARELHEHIKTYDSVAREGKPDPESMILSAIRSGSADMLDLVVKTHGPGLALRDTPNFNTPMHFAATQRNGLDLVKHLLDLGHDAAAANRFAWTPLDFARQLDNRAVVEALEFKPGADRFAGDIGKEGTSNNARQKEEDMMLAAVRMQQGDLADLLISKVCRMHRPSCRLHLSLLPPRVVSLSPHLQASPCLPVLAASERAPHPQGARDRLIGRRCERELGAALRGAAAGQPPDVRLAAARQRRHGRAKQAGTPAPAPPLAPGVGRSVRVIPRSLPRAHPTCRSQRISCAQSCAAPPERPRRRAARPRRLWTRRVRLVRKEGRDVSR
jgi:hypothetical protein